MSSDLTRVNIASIPKPVWVLAVILSWVVFGLAAYPGGLGLYRKYEPGWAQAERGYLHSVAIPDAIWKPRPRWLLPPDDPAVYQGTSKLSRSRSSADEIANAGCGRYGFRGRNLQFSFLENSAPSAEVVILHVPLWSIPEWLLLALAAIPLILTSAACQCGGTSSRGRIDGHGAMDPLWTYGAVLAATLALIFAVIQAQAVADAFLLGLFAPAAWAAFMARFSRFSSWAEVLVGILLALLPAYLAFVYYGYNAASDGSFLIGGAIPCSDAMVHFMQAADIALDGTTTQFFNGRLLYPASMAVLLRAFHCDVQVAAWVYSSIVMLSMGAAAVLLRQRFGHVVTGLFCLGFWLYFRTYGAGLLMTENLGILMGTWSLIYLLIWIDQRKTWQILAAVVFFSLGSVARPGALLILPAMALICGLQFLRPGAQRFALIKFIAGVTMGFLVIVLCFLFHSLAVKTFYHGEGRAFGNFAFTLHGLLNNTKWSTSAAEYHWDSRLVMQNNIRQIQDDPSSLFRGISRAYREAFKKAFLFRFGKEKLMANLFLVLFLMTLLFWWVDPVLRRHGIWIVPMALGLVASVPFAPPWDAAERPYAVSIPFQYMMVGCGVIVCQFVVSQLVRRILARTVPQESCSWTASVELTDGIPLRAAYLFSGVCIVWVCCLPFGLRLMPVVSHRGKFLPGSSLIVTESSRRCRGQTSMKNYLDRLSVYQESSPEKQTYYIPPASECVIGVDWAEMNFVQCPLDKWDNKSRLRP